jgi:hypothetical protein
MQNHRADLNFGGLASRQVVMSAVGQKLPSRP